MNIERVGKSKLKGTVGSQRETITSPARWTSPPKKRSVDDFSKIETFELKRGSLETNKDLISNGKISEKKVFLCFLLLEIYGPILGRAGRSHIDHTGIKGLKAQWTHTVFEVTLSSRLLRIKQHVFRSLLRGDKS